MTDGGVAMTVDVLLKLLTEDQWEVRHGGLLGIKYALAVRQVRPVLASHILNFLSLLMRAVFLHVTKSLNVTH